MGFVLTPEDAQTLIAHDARNKDVLFPYMNGEDLNSRPDQSPSRWIINFCDWPIEKAMEYPDCFRIVEEKVKPERLRLGEKKDSSAKGYARWWWQYARQGKELYHTIAGMERVLVTAEVSKHVNFAFRPPNEVFSHMLIVFPLSTLSGFAVVQSTIHELWCRDKSSTLESRFRYAPTDCFETFPFPYTHDGLGVIGEQYHAHRQQIMFAKKEGLTKTYNRFHDSSETSADFQKLRELHAGMDRAVVNVYGWTDLNLNHGFHETKQGVRYTISETARREVLARLLKLNHERYAEEVKRGLHETKKVKATSKPQSKTTTTKPAATTTQPLFTLDGEDPVFPSTIPEKVLCGLLCDLVVAEPGLPATAYLDALVITMRPQRHGRLLVGPERKKFIALADKLLTPQDRDATTISWRLLSDTLTDEAAIHLDGSALVRGDHFGERRKAYPPCEAKLVQLIHKAATTLRDYQGLGKPNSTDCQEALSAFNEDKRTLCGALT